MKQKMLIGISFIVVLSLIYFATTFIGGNTRNVEVSISSTENHSEDDIKKVIRKTKSHFHWNFSGCTLTDLQYTDSFLYQESDWIEQFNGEEAIVLTSSFDVDDSGGDGSFNPNSTYDNWQWVYVKDSKGNWDLKTYGDN